MVLSLLLLAKHSRYVLVVLVQVQGVVRNKRYSKQAQKQKGDMFTEIFQGNKYNKIYCCLKKSMRFFWL